MAGKQQSKKKEKRKSPAKGGKLENALRPNKGKPFQRPKPSKKKEHESKGAPAPPEISASLLAGEEDAPAFPRGGASLLSRSEEAEARAEAEEEFEREERESKKHLKDKKRGTGKPRQEGEDGWASLFSEGISGKLPRFANRVTLKNISPNMKLWGVVAEVNPKDLVISLPGGLRGFVRAEEASDIFSDNKFKDLESNLLCSIFHIGQLVPCIVIQVDDDKKEGKGSKRILLSLHLSLLHQNLTLDSIQDGMVMNALVKSIEDHGYILQFGVSSFSGFLPKSGQDGNKITLKTGQLIQGVVKNTDKVRGVVYLSSDADLVAKSMVKDLRGLSIDALVPGMMVNARVHATLENGIMLSFLTYFTGTVDIFHLQEIFPGITWKDGYFQNKKVNARILFVDPSTRAVGLTLNPHLIRNSAPPSYVKTGDIFDNSRIVRVDRGIGFLVEIPSIPEVSSAYISRFDAADEDVQKLEKKFKEGAHVRVRILGFRHLEGLAIGTLKASAFEGSIFTHSDVKPGMLARAKIIAVESFGAIVQFSSGVKALCPLSHMSEFEIAKPAKKFKVGAQLLFRVLGCKSKRITVTYKKTLVKSKLDVLASYADAIEGLVTHGWITKIEKHGCFVKFYNGVHGFAHRSELGLEPGGEPSSVYHAGQVVKCRIVSSIPASRRINLSFNLSPKRATGSDQAKLGTLVSGVVERLTPGAVILELNELSHQKGTIYNEHLADHHGHNSILKSLLRPGHKFDQLLVLDVDGDNLILSAKQSLVEFFQDLPLDVAQICPQSVVHGYICNVISSGCFVRFLGRLTGFAPLNKTSDEQVGDLSDAFYVGQSVRSHIINVNNQTSRISLSLKQSSCFSTDVSFIRGYFHLEEKIAELQSSNAENSDSSGMRNFRIGQLVEGEIQEKKEYGFVFSFKDHSDIVGFITHFQLGGRNVEKGSSVKALVLDISAAEGVIDLSLKAGLLNSFSEGGAKSVSLTKKRRRDAFMDLELHDTVNAVVEMVKENYLVLSLAENNNAIGFASLIDYNTQKLPRRNFVEGQSVLATVEALPSPASSGRLLLLLKSLSEVSETSSSKRAKKKSAYTVGSLVQAEITDIKPLELFLKFGMSCSGRVHITEVTDDGCLMNNPFMNFRIGQLLTARIVSKALKLGKGRRGYQWELSLKPSMVSGDVEASEISFAEFSFSIGQAVRGYVVKVDNEWVSLALSRFVHAQLYILDSSCEPSELQEFQKRYSVGDAVSGHVISLDKEKKLLRLMSGQPSVFYREALVADAVRIDATESATSNLSGAEHIHKGDIVGGKIKKILPGVGGLLVQIGPHLYGKAHYTELTDMWTSDPLSGYQEGMYVKCKILEISRSAEGFVHVDLSLRTSLQGTKSSLPGTPDCHNMDSLTNRFDSVDGLHPNMDVKGYVKNISPKGCFVMLSRKIDGRVLLSNLSDEYTENPQQEFPVGKLVHGRVLSVEPLSRRVDVTLKTYMGERVSKCDVSDFNNLHVGDVISGRIKRVESYGLFVTIDSTNVVGLCHISELSDSPVENIESKYRAGGTVMVKILKVDQERRRVSLGMKSLYDGDDSNVPTVSNNKTDNPADGNGDGTFLDAKPNLNLDLIQDIYSKIALANSRASVPPLDVKLDDLCGSDLDNDATVGEKVNVNSTVAEKSNRRLKKKEREEREIEISAFEERRLQNDIPRTADEFEKLVRSSPNSSYVWIHYMALFLKLADIEKARSVAERALRTINIREEDEKLNVWVAYLNLENEYGSPREEAVRKTFERALQYCDPKKLYLALLAIYEKTEQHTLAEELLEKMIKKFRSSCKVWLHRVQSLLKQGKDGVQSIVKRALLSLPRNKHIKFISQSAILEFKCGVPDRGRSMFEGILREYPKRTDLWSVYLDQEIRLGDVEVIRALFERATCLSLHPKKMKFLLKKYLEYEKSLGNEEQVEYVTRKALEYAENSLT